MFEFLRPPFHPNFIAGLHTLTEDYDAHSYRRYGIIIQESVFCSDCLF